jgi:hypothetical protein
MEDVCQVLDVFLDGSNEDGCIIHVERGSENVSSAPNFVEKPVSGGDMKNLSKWVNDEHGE